MGRRVVTSLLSSGCVATLFAAPLLAQTTSSTKTRMAIFESQSRLLDGRLSEQYEFSSRLRPEPEIERIPSFRGSYRGEFLDTARTAARRYGIPEDLYLRLVQQESGWNVAAVSSKGAVGLAQLLPTTATSLGVDPHDPGQNLDGGARYLRDQFDRFGSWQLALAAYNAGPEAVAEYDGVPPFAETESYVRRILGR